MDLVVVDCLGLDMEAGCRPPQRCLTTCGAAESNSCGRGCACMRQLSGPQQPVMLC